MANKPQPAPQKGNFKQGQLTLWLSVGFVVLVIMSLPTVMIIFFGLLPTIVSAIIDRTPKKNATFCIGSINLCGVFPYMMDLWLGDNTMEGAMRILTDVFSLIVMYGAAAFGWMIFQSLPPVVATFVTVIAQSRVSSLRSTQRQLIDEWGDDVGTPQEVLDMRDQLGEEAIEAAANADPNAAPASTGNADTDALLDGIDSLLGGNGKPSSAPPSSPPAAAGTPPKTV
ncbi:MAG: hypothetical protein HOL66_15980 [Rhodospirillaceae bacterium]|jgi:hypothetical protein|nr:hypothetical protein [Rhodospirillaceae bacterium]MBT5245733.1 hypothetical protein [Rhodospirillaceae bacterium]MBT5561477.1 hypothetical protein [Rhodospirillaceae bacterium]MBT6242923.1 hypothetical protein [Rhodospirillaceae bacterium]MBT7138243.1 hypothetical protein [Rhodospirillaceae bacterium]